MMWLFPTARCMTWCSRDGVVSWHLMAYVLNNSCTLTDLQDDHFVTYPSIYAKESQVWVCPEFLRRRNKEINYISCDNPKVFHCIIHQQAICWGIISQGINLYAPRFFKLGIRRFTTLQRTLFIYLINKNISLSDICLTVHHWYK